MKIIRIINELDFGGVEQVLYSSILSLKEERKLIIKVIVLGKGGEISNSLKKEGIEIFELNYKYKIPNFLLIKILYTIIKEESPDVIHCQGGESNFHGILASKLANVPRIIGEEIGIPNHHSYWKYIFKYIYKKANSVIAISNAVKNSIIELGEIESDKVVILYNPIDYNKINRLYRTIVKNESLDLKFITTARLVPVKNLYSLIESFNEVLRKNLKEKIVLEIIGEGPEKNNLLELVDRLGLDKHVRFLGFQNNVFPFLINSDVFILPSLREGSSVSLLEAMAVGLPSIVTKVGGAKEILGGSNYGILVDPFDKLDIQNAMEFYIEKGRERIYKDKEEIRQRAKLFGIDEFKNQLLKLYNFN